MKFGDNLKKLRKAHKLSQEALAEKMSVSRQSVSKWENGESYPEMNNILELCKIFSCNINDLVNDSILDINSLDEEVKGSVVKLEQEKQNRLKGLSKAIYIIAKICKVFITIMIPIMLIIAFIAPIIMNRIDIDGNEITFDGAEEISIVIEDPNVVIEYDGEKITDEELSSYIIKYKELVDKHSKTMLIVYFELGVTVLIITLILYRETLKHLEELFVGINKGDTPFTLINAEHIKKMAYLLIAAIALPIVSGIIFEAIMGFDLEVSFGLIDVVEILFLFSMAYIFEYGYELQLDSKGRMYGEKNE